MNGNGPVRPDDGAPTHDDTAPPPDVAPVRRGSPAPTRRQGALLAGLAVAAAVLVGVALALPDAGAAPTTPPAGQASTGPGATVAATPGGPPTPGGPATATPAGSQPPAATPRATPTPTLDPTGWASADLPPYEPVAELTATRSGPAGTSVATAFRLTSRAGAAADLARGIQVTPPVQLAVAPGPTSTTVLLTPAAPLAQGTTYRVVLRRDDGSLGGSWVFRTGSPPRVAGTLPGDQTTNVPPDTGIEVTFDQDGVGDVASFFSISPTVAGRFERHGRTAVFVPERLQPLTTYTVTIRRGVPLAGSELALEEDVTFRFETAAKAGATAPSPPWLAAAETLVETSVGERPVLELHADEGLRRVDVGVYRLAGLEAAVDAYLALRDVPQWADRSDTGLVATKGLPRVARFTATLGRWPGSDRGGGWIRFPAALPAGWYLVSLPRAGRDVQLVLQVTDVQATTIAASGTTLVWAHDLATGGPLPGATVQVLDGTRIGETGADGLLLATTPVGLLAADVAADPRASIVVIRAPGAGSDTPGRTTFVPLGGWSAEIPFQDRFWRLLYTDRSLFRTSDTIEAWGLLQPRDGSATPAAELRLDAGTCYEGDATCGSTAIVSVPISPKADTGVFTASVPITGLPTGEYELGLWVGEHRVAATSLSVGIIRKPAYQLEVATDRRVAIAGDRVAATVTATFFDGTRVPGVEIAVAGMRYDDEAEPAGSTTTGGDGTGRVEVALERPYGQSDWQQIAARPAGPEEGSISASTQVLVFGSRVVLDGQATLDGTSLRVDGTVHGVDLERLERELRAGREPDLRQPGPVVAGATVSARIVERWQVGVRTGQVYDFIAKKVVATYEYRDRSKVVGTRRVTTDAAGRFALRVRVPVAGHAYEVTVSAADADARTAELLLWVDQAASASPRGGGLPTLTLEVQDSWGSDAPYAVGDAVRATVRTASGAAMATGGSRSYLFFTARPGMLDARIQASPRFRTTFTEADVPSLSIGAAWFDGSNGGVTSVDWGCGATLPTVEARFDASTRPIVVELAADAAHHRPGETVTVDVRTSDRSGQPITADVVLRAIDEKLYALGGALEGDALEQLYWWMPGEDGIASVATTHPMPVYVPGSQSTCGPGAFGRDDIATRDDFRDTLLFQRVTTDADGRASVAFDLSDDLTSWRVSAAAISARREVGRATLQVPVGLPLFVEAPLAPDYLAGDRPVLRVRAYGEALAAGDPVSFTVAAPSLGMSATTVAGQAFAAVEIPLPALRAGDHEVTIEASAGSGTGAAGDRLVRTIHVVDTRFTQRRAAWADLADGLPQAGGTGLLEVVFADAGRARHVGTLEALANGGGARLDQALAAAIAQDLLVGTFGVDPARFASAPFDPARYLVQAVQSDDTATPISGIALLPYASPDAALSARAALVAGDRLDAEALKTYFRWLRAAADDPEFESAPPPASTRESRNIALAGLAGLGEGVIPDIRAALGDPDLTIRERLYLALGAAALGDHATALGVERDLLASNGERLGPWLRLRVGSSLDDTIEATALVALIGATVGDPAAEPAEAYIEANRAADDLLSLQQAGYIARVLDRTPAEAARVAYTLDGVERTVDIPAGDALGLRLTPAQWAAFTARTASGRVGVAVSWDAPVAPTSLAPDPSLTLKRTVVAGSTLPADRIVDVTLSATFGPLAVAGCYEVTDVLPSGLADADTGGQRVSACLGPNHSAETYHVRVVTPGTYRWEPAILQLAGAPESLALTPETQVEIR